MEKDLRTRDEIYYLTLVKILFISFVAVLILNIVQSHRIEELKSKKEDLSDSVQSKDFQLKNYNDELNDIYSSFQEVSMARDILAIENEEILRENGKLQEAIDIETKRKEREAKAKEELKAKGSWKNFQMTHYTANCEGCSGITYSGHDARQSIYKNGKRVIATDPNVIPQGSIVEIDDGGFVFRAQALDIGSAIKGNIVDLLVDGNQNALSLGRKNVKIRVIRSGW
jgi:3D (Asp-Asp-Asp) domain-containing protein